MTLPTKSSFKIGKKIIYEIDLQDNVNYFPVIQAGSSDDGSSYEAHLVT